MAYDTTEEMINLAQPTVLVTLQCQTKDAVNKRAREFSSAVAKTGDLRILKIGGHDTIVVQGFHPSTFLKDWDEEEETEEEEIEESELGPKGDLLEYAILAALNAAGGCGITGHGKWKLQTRVRDNIYGPWDQEPPAVIKLLKEIKLSNEVREIILHNSPLVCLISLRKKNTTGV